MSRFSLRRLAVMVLGGLVVLVVLLAAAGVAYEKFAGRAFERSHPAPGRLIDIGSHRLHIVCAGQGEPTVLLEAGLGEGHRTWSTIAGGLTKLTRVCRYDRAGYGWSDSGPAPRSIDPIVTELELLLDGAGESGPFVLVGHSFGGLIVRLFAIANPDDVVGLVLIDPSHEDQEEVLPQLPLWLRVIASGIQRSAVFGLPRLGLSLVNPSDEDQEESINLRLMVQTKTMRAVRLETAELDQSLARVRSEEGLLDELPLTVISAGRPTPLPGLFDEAETDRAVLSMQELHRRLASRSANGEHLVAQDSEHFVHRDQPDLVIEAIGEVVFDARQAGK